MIETPKVINYKIYVESENGDVCKEFITLPVSIFPDGIPDAITRFIFNKIAETMLSKGDQKKVKYGDKIYKQGLEDAWEAARKIILSYKDYSALKPSDFKEVFGTVDISEVLEKFTAAEAIAKIKKHEKKQVINVGDEIRYSDNRKGVVLQVFQYWDEDKNHNENSYKVLCSNGCGQLIYDIPVYNIKKTGRHFPQVEEMLKAMKEE